MSSVGVYACVVSLAAGVALGCTKPASNPPGQTGTASDPNLLRIGVATPSNNAVTQLVNNLTADSYVGIGWNGRLAERVVTSWAWQPGMSGVTVSLRPKLQFHDGTPVDLQIFREALLATLKAKQPAGTNVSFKSVTSVDLVLKEDGTYADDQLLIKLSRPEAFFLDDLANQSLRKPKSDQIGTGPFRLESSEGNVRLAAFKEYYRGAPKISALEIHRFAEPRAAWTALMRDEIDAVHEMMENTIAPGQKALRAYSFVRPYYYQLLFNVRHPILKNAGVRQALSYGIDRQAVVEHALGGQGTVAEGPIWPYHWAYSTAQKVYTHNSEAATLRLDSAGLKVKKAPQPGQMPSRLRIRCLIVANNAQFEKLALILQKQLYEIGVDLQIEPEPGETFLGRLNTGNFDTVLVTRTSGRSLAWTYLSFFSSESPGGYSAADKVLDTLRRTTAEPTIRAAVSDLQQILHDDPPAIFIAWPKVARVVSAKFEVPEEDNADRASGRDVLSSLWQWKPTGAPTR